MNARKSRKSIIIQQNKRILKEKKTRKIGASTQKKKREEEYLRKRTKSLKQDVAISSLEARRAKKSWR